ncbi:MAG: AgmX/PglI C-terminal domain-containing protein [Pseudomonadota bacterium]
MNLPFYREYSLPWSVSSSDEKKFRKTLLTTMGVISFLGAVWPFLPVQEKDPFEVEEIPPRFAKLVLEEKPEPPPPPPPEPEPEEPEPETEEPEKVVEETPPEPEPLPEPEVTPEPTAREQAAVAGLLPFAEDLASLTDNELVSNIADQRDLSDSVGADSANERSLITSNIAGGSSGINTANLSRNTGGSGLVARATTSVDSPVEGVGSARSNNVRRSGTSNKASRSQEEIELVFDRNKGAIYRLYNRALREDPTLQGKLVLRLTIAPDGSVTMCEVVSSELGNAELERKLVQRVKLFRFDAKDVEAITTTKPIDFFPA